MKNFNKESAWAYINAIVENRKRLEVSVKAALYDYGVEIDSIKEKFGMLYITKLDFDDFASIKHISVDNEIFMSLGLVKDCEVDYDDKFGVYFYRAKIKDFVVGTTTAGKDLREVAAE